LCTLDLNPLYRTQSRLFQISDETNYVTGVEGMKAQLPRSVVPIKSTNSSIQQPSIVDTKASPPPWGLRNRSEDRVWRRKRKAAGWRVHAVIRRAARIMAGRGNDGGVRARDGWWVQRWIKHETTLTDLATVWGDRGRGWGGGSAWRTRASSSDDTKTHCGGFSEEQL
jgi:hypothetical protein